MNLESGPYRLFWCFPRDGQRQQLAFPSNLIESSQTGGNEEVSSFLSRMEVARHAVNRFPDFKVTFGEHFYSSVLKIASHDISITAARCLAQRLATADHQALEQVARYTNRYPYMILRTTPSGDSVLTPALDALSVPLMARAVQNIVGPVLERVFSQDDAATWGMTHILAWTLETFARSEDLRQSVAELDPAEADKAIWNHAWRGDDYRARFMRAVHILSSELAASFLKAIDLGKRELNWIEALLGFRSSSYYLEVASEARRGENHVLNWVTTTYAGLPASAALAVAEILREEGWRKFAVERDRRRFVFKEARRKNQKFDSMVLGCVGLNGLPHYRADHWDQCGLQALAAGRDSIIFSTLDFTAPGTSDITATDALLTLNQAISAADLPLDALRVMYAKMQGYTRENAHIPLGISKKRVAAAWRELNRKKGVFVKLLSPKPAMTSTLQ